MEELAIINILKQKPSATQKSIAEMSGKSERAIKRRTVEMQEKGLIARENGNKFPLFYEASTGDSKRKIYL